MAAATPNPLEALIDMLADKVAERLASRTQPAPSRLMTVKEAASYLGRSAGAVQQLVARHEIPAVRADRRIHIDRRDIDLWIARNRVE